MAQQNYNINPPANPSVERQETVVEHRDGAGALGIALLFIIILFIGFVLLFRGRVFTGPSTNTQNNINPPANQTTPASPSTPTPTQPTNPGGGTTTTPTY